MLSLAAGRIGVQDVTSKMTAYDITPIVNGVAKHVQPGTWTVVAIDDTGQVALHPFEVTANGPSKVEFTPSWQAMPR
jgi:hypothetical protein